MTPLRRRMTEDMQVRNFSPHTQNSYVQQVSLFARHFSKSPEVLEPEEIRSYQVYLTNEKKLAPSSILIAVSALRFLYKVTLHRDWCFEDIIPAPKKPQTLPIVLSPEEVLQFLSCVQSVKHRTILTVCYAAGLRISEAVRLKVAVITIDDEWNSQYYVAWPILKEFGYPFTLFIYTQWVATGGKAMTWAQLGEMRDAGVDLEAHTVSHHDLRHAPRGQDYTTWLHNEVYGCKETLENKLGVKIIAFAFPYGFHNEVVRKTAKEAGYEMQFTVYGRHMDINVPADQIGRYAIDSLKGDVFKAALDFGRTDSTQPGVETSQLASAAMLTEPLNDQHITEPKPTIKANLASMGDVDPKSVEMRISGFGLVPAVYDPKTKLVTYAFTQKLVPKMYTVILTAKVNGKKVETRWDFTVDPAGPVATNQ